MRRASCKEPGDGDRSRSIARRIPYNGTVLRYTGGRVRRRWTFRSRSRATKTLATFYLVNLAGLALNAGSLNLSLNLLSLGEMPSLLLATIGATVWIFTLSKLTIFRE